jgi:ribose transport system substrate-binding protein
MSRFNGGRRSSNQVRESFHEFMGTGLSRRQLLRGAGAIGFTIGAGGVLTACGDETSGSGGTSGSKDFGSATIGDSWHSLQLAIIADRARGGELAAKALNQKYQGISADFDSGKQLSDVQTAIAGGSKAINVVPLEAPSVNAFAPQAVEAGTLFTVSYNSPAWKTPPEYGAEYVTYTAPDDYQTGVTTTTELAEALGGKGRIVVLAGLEGATADILRNKGIDDTLSKYPNIELVTRVHTDWTSVDANEKMSAILSSNDDIAGVIGNDDDLGIGAFQALSAAGSQAKIVSSDGFEASFELIANEPNYLGTVNTYTTWVGGFLLVRLFDALNGWKPEPAETMMFWPSSFAKKDDATKLLDRFYKGSSDPYDWEKMSRVIHPDDWDAQELMVTMDPERLWDFAAPDDKPDGWALPEGFDADSRAEIDALYDEHWVTRA